MQKPEDGMGLGFYVPSSDTSSFIYPAISFAKERQSSCGETWKMSKEKPVEGVGHFDISVYYYS